MLLLKESCHFDSHHQGNGCTVPQSSALSTGGLGFGGVCTALALVYLCKPALNGQTPRPGAIATAASERKSPHGDRETNPAMSAIYGKTENRRHSAAKPAETALFGCVCCLCTHDKDVF